MLFDVNKFGFFWDRHLVLNTNYKNHRNGKKHLPLLGKYKRILCTIPLNLSQRSGLDILKSANI